MLRKPSVPISWSASMRKSSRIPRQAVLDIYKHIEVTPDQLVIEWAEKNVRKSKKECYKYDPRWQEAYQEMGLDESLDLARLYQSVAE